MAAKTGLWLQNNDRSGVCFWTDSRPFLASLQADPAKAYGPHRVRLRNEHVVRSPPSPARRAALQVLNQRNRVLAQPLVPLVGDEIIVLDADAARSRDVQPRLQRDHVAGQQRLRGVPHEVGRLRMR